MALRQNYKEQEDYQAMMTDIIGQKFAGFLQAPPGRQQQGERCGGDRGGPGDVGGHVG